MSTSGRRLGGHGTDKQRRFRNARTNEAIHLYEAQIIWEEKKQRENKERQKMADVVEFFQEEYKGILTEEELERPFKWGTKSQYGMILYIDRLGNFPGWRERALAHFNIDIT